MEVRRDIDSGQVNYLSHYHLNHAVRGLPIEPYFVMGVALPDMWTRFSRAQRIRWSVVRSAAPLDDVTAALRDGMLNHVEADRWFHTLPVFLRWQRAVKRAAAGADGGETHPAVIDFLAHVAVELALDSQLVTADGDLAERFYASLSACDLRTVETAAAHLSGTQTAGLARIIGGFVRRRYLERYDDPQHLRRILRLVLHKARLRQHPPESVVETCIAAALECACIEDVMNPASVEAARSSEPHTPPEPPSPSEPGAGAPGVCETFVQA